MIWFGNKWNVDIVNPKTKVTRSVEIYIEAYIITFLTFGRGLFIDGAKQEHRVFDVCILCHWSPHLEWSHTVTIEGQTVQIVFNSLSCPFTPCFDLFIDGHLHGSKLSKTDYYKKFSVVSIARSLFACIVFVIIFAATMTTFLGVGNMPDSSQYRNILLAAIILSGSLLAYFGILLISSIAALIRFHYFSIAPFNKSQDLDTTQVGLAPKESLV